MLARVRLLDIALSHLLHDEVAVDMHLLSKMGAIDTPLAGDGQGAGRRLRNDLGVDALRHVGESEPVSGLRL